MIRVLIVDDSLTVRKAVAARLRDAGMEVVGEGSDGTEGIRLTRDLDPDVVLMDVVMPGCDGLTATRQIMRECPKPIVILSAHASQSEVFQTFDALAAGALEVCSKPVGQGVESDSAWTRIIRTLRAASDVCVTRILSGRDRSEPVEGDNAIESIEIVGRAEPEIVVIGASTGGPSAVLSIMKALPSSFPLPILIAIHCGSRCSGSLAEWLDLQSSLPVRDARDGMRISSLDPTAWIAPAGSNLSICGDRIQILKAAEDQLVVPEINALFESAAHSIGKATIGVLLTGMGDDGSKGLLEIRNRGGRTLAQDAESCVVNGMPAAACSLGAVEHVTPLLEIPNLLLQLTHPRQSAATRTGAT